MSTEEGTEVVSTAENKVSWDVEMVSFSRGKMFVETTSIPHEGGF